MPGWSEERRNLKGNAYLAGYFVLSLKTVCNQVSGVLAKFGVSPRGFSAWCAPPPCYVQPPRRGSGKGPPAGLGGQTGRPGPQHDRCSPRTCRPKYGVALCLPKSHPCRLSGMSSRHASSATYRLQSWRR